LTFSTLPEGPVPRRAVDVGPRRIPGGPVSHGCSPGSPEPRNPYDIGPGHVPGGPWPLIVTAATAGPFVTAFCTELGKRFGGSVADWIARVRRSQAGVTLDIPVDGDITVVELAEDLPDDARLALIDLDFTNPSVRGHRLRWDAETQSWVTIEARSH
jgi:hypothetical protein